MAKGHGWADASSVGLSQAFSNFRDDLSRFIIFLLPCADSDTYKQLTFLRCSEQRLVPRAHTHVLTPKSIQTWQWSAFWDHSRYIFMKPDSFHPFQLILFSVSLAGRLKTLSLNLWTCRLSGRLKESLGFNSVEGIVCGWWCYVIGLACDNSASPNTLVCVAGDIRIVY